MNINRLVIASVIIGLSLIGAGAFVYGNRQKDKKEPSSTVVETKPVEDNPMAGQETDQETDQETVASDNGSYVTLADYSKDLSKYANTNKVYFFHASWCSICQNIDKEINSDTSKIPANTTLIKVDFDNSKDLRQKYGVTTQYTFVQIDNDDNEIAQWSATSFAKAIGSIKY